MFDLALSGLPVRDLLSDRVGLITGTGDWVRLPWAAAAGNLEYGPYPEYPLGDTAGMYMEGFPTQTGAYLQTYGLLVEEEGGVAARLRWWDYNPERHFDLWAAVPERASKNGWRLMVEDTGGGMKIYLELWYEGTNYRLLAGYGATATIPPLGPGDEIAIFFSEGEVIGLILVEEEWQEYVRYGNDFHIAASLGEYVALGGSGAGNRYLDNLRAGSRLEAEGIAPSNLVAPSISGTAQVGQTLNLDSVGTWSPPPTGYAYGWQHSPTGVGEWSNIAGAESTTYTIAEAYVNQYIRAVVQASNGAGTNEAFSAATEKVKAKAGAARRRFSSVT